MIFYIIRSGYVEDLTNQTFISHGFITNNKEGSKASFTQKVLIVTRALQGKQYTHGIH